MKVTLHSVILERQVRNWEGVFEELGAERFPRVLQWSVNRVAADAQDYTGEAKRPHRRPPRRVHPGCARPQE